MKPFVRQIHWLPRVLCILAILFITMFSLDAFDPKLTIWQQIAGFIIHSIPSFILTALLLISWKWELTGGIIFTVIGTLLSPFIFIKNFGMNHSVWLSLSVILLITFPFIVVGVLFILSYYLKKNNAPPDPEDLREP